MEAIGPEMMGMLTLGGVGTILLIGAFIFVTKIYHRVDQGQALIINTPSKTKVTFNGGVVVPVFYRAEYMDISLKTIDIDRRGKEGLICADNIRADIRVTFFVRVNPTGEAVRKVAESVGCERASDQETLEALFQAKFSEALKTVGKQLEFEQLYTQRDDFRDRILKEIGGDLNGYSLEDAAIDYLEQTPVKELDVHNILDAQGIEKITKLTEDKRVETTKLRNKAKKDVELDNLETKKALFRYQKEEAEEEAEKNKAIEVVQAQKKAEAEKIKAEELAKEETARLEAQEKVNVREIGKLRAEELAEKDRERALAVETEKVEREKQIEIIAREREVALQNISKDKEVEVEKKEIAEIVRDRVSVDKTVAEEEERIKDLKVLMEAERTKKAQVIAAEAEAEQKLIVDIKAAEAAEEAAKHKAKQKIIEADAELDASDRVAKAKIRLAEGVQAEQAAEGLAKVKVKEADAVANEKQGLVDAKILREKMLAEAQGEEEQGMVDIRLKQSMAEAIEKEGLAEAQVLREKMLAEAKGSEEQGLVDVRVKEALAQAIEKEGLAEAKVLAEKGQAEAVALEKKGLAEGVAIREKLAAEASGIEAKADAMKHLDGPSKDHEEFRLHLEHDRLLSMERIKSSIEIAQAQAEAMGEAFKAADINIVGGDESFYQNFLKSVSVGQMVEGFMEHSPTAQALFSRLTDGKPNGVPSNGAHDGVTPQKLQSVLGDMLDTADSDEERTRVQALMDQVDDLGGSGEPEHEA
jgi:uncharacterized membrane protein YqiK